VLNLVFLADFLKSEDELVTILPDDGFLVVQSCFGEGMGENFPCFAMISFTATYVARQLNASHSRSTHARLMGMAWRWLKHQWIAENMLSARLWCMNVCPHVSLLHADIMLLVSHQSSLLLS
jgi:hypothetical protein